MILHRRNRPQTLRYLWQRFLTLNLICAFTFANKDYKSSDKIKPKIFFTLKKLQAYLKANFWTICFRFHILQYHVCFLV